MKYSEQAFRTFVVVALIIFIGLAGWSFVKSEEGTRANTDNALVAKQLATEVAEVKANEVSTRISNEKLLCGKINELINYNKVYSTNTLKQTEAQAKSIDRALAGKTSLTPEEVHFVNLFVHSIVALEKSSPKLINLNPYTFADLKCNVLARQIEESSTQTHTLYQEVFKSPFPKE